MVITNSGEPKTGEPRVRPDVYADAHGLRGWLGHGGSAAGPVARPPHGVLQDQP